MVFFLVFLSTTAGAAPVLIFTKLSLRAESTLLGASAGIMLGATFFSLLQPSLDLYQKQGYAPIISALFVAAFLLLGAVLLYFFHQNLPHEHLFKGAEGVHAQKLSKQWLVILAVALHNIPEGLAVGVGLGSGDTMLGLSLAIAIALQDFPEGLIVALGLKTIGMPFRKILTITAITGLMEGVGVLLGMGAISIAQSLLPAAFALCAGAMLFVVSHEVIPESHRNGHEKEATAGILLGFALIMVLDLGL